MATSADCLRAARAARTLGAAARELTRRRGAGGRHLGTILGDRALLEEMTLHHQGAIEMAQLALQNAQHDQLKQMAGDIVAAQSSEIAQMTRWQAAWFGQ